LVQLPGYVPLWNQHPEPIGSRSATPLLQISTSSGTIPRLGQQFIIENRPGGNSNIATEAVVRAPPDGYTLLVVDNSPAINVSVYDKLNFRAVQRTSAPARTTKAN
jgi:hypothetical protein